MHNEHDIEYTGVTTGGLSVSRNTGKVLKYFNVGTNYTFLRFVVLNSEQSNKTKKNV